MTDRRRVVVGPDQAGNRLDRALTDLVSDWTRSRIRKWIDDGRVFRNGRDARQSERVAEGDVLEVDVPEPVAARAEPEDIPLDVLWEDDDLLVLNKPANLVIHPAAGNPDGTLVNALLHYCKNLSGIGGVQRPGIVHRLDKDTTGAMVVAKTDRAHLGLSLAFTRRTVRKEYLAVCYGLPDRHDGVIDVPIDRHRQDRKRMAVREDGQSARTLYRIEEPLRGTCAVVCRLITGRTHQIRVHLAHIGHALVGDPVYSGRQWRNLEALEVRNACRDFPRQALHSRTLRFEHPVTDEIVAIEAPLPEDLAALIETLRG